MYRGRMGLKISLWFL